MLGVLAFFQGGADLDEIVPEWVFNAIIIGYLAAHVVLVPVPAGGTPLSPGENGAGATRRG